MVTIVNAKPKAADMTPSTFGEWRVDYGRAEITHVPSNYSVAVGELTTAAEVLDWLVQVSHKNWASPKTVGELLVIMDAVLSLQTNVCGSGVDPDEPMTSDEARDHLEVFRDGVKSLNPPWQLDKLEPR